MGGRSFEMMLMSTLGQVAALVHQYDRVELLVRMVQGVSVEKLHEKLLHFARVYPRNEPTQKCLSFYSSMEWRGKCLRLSKSGT
jgi:hypothetical protein